MFDESITPIISSDITMENVEELLYLEVENLSFLEMMFGSLWLYLM